MAVPTHEDNLRNEDILKNKGLTTQLNQWHYQELTKEVYTLLRRYTEGDAKLAVESAGGDGLEAYRALNKSSENHASGKVCQFRKECTKMGGKPEPRIQKILPRCIHSSMQFSQNSEKLRAQSLTKKPGAIS